MPEAKSTDSASLAKGLDVALEIDKQIITVATAVLALTATFFQSTEALSRWQQLLLGGSWCLFALAAMLGLIVFMICAGALTGDSGVAVIERLEVRLVAGSQILIFMLGIVALVLFALARLIESGT